MQDETSRDGRALLSRVDKAHAITLVLECPRDGEGCPAVLLALILIGWRAHSLGQRKCPDVAGEALGTRYPALETGEGRRLTS